MHDETIGPDRYRTGLGDRAIPLVLGIAGAASLPWILWASGPFWWPWGLGASLLVAVAGAAAVRRWWSALEAVHWVDGGLEFRRRRRSFRIDSDSLTRVSVRPASARTWLWTGRRRRKLSHRLVRIDGLLGELRLRRPDLFPGPTEDLTLRVSGVAGALQAILSFGTVLAGGVLWVWQPGVGLIFLVAGGVVLLGALGSVPRSYEIGHGRLIVRFWFGRRFWNQVEAIREDSYVAGGAVFFRMVLVGRGRTLVLDEGRLLDPLRPHAEWIRSQWFPPVR